MTATPPPLPVEPLQYDSAPAQRSLHRLLRGLGLLLIVVGGLQFMAHGAHLATWLLGWADPYFWKFRSSQGSISGIPSSYLLTAAGVTECLCGLAALVAGLACLARRPWAWSAAVWYAAAQIASRLLFAAGWLSTYLDPSSGIKSERFANSVAQIAWFVESAGLPVVVLLLAFRRRDWQNP